MTTLTEFATQILEDGKIDEDEVKAIETRLYDDGKIDQDEVAFLFNLNNQAGETAHPSFRTLFAKAVTDYCLADDNTPGVLDTDEWDFLKGQIEGDGKVDATEVTALASIAASATQTPDDFQAFTLAAVKASIVEDGVVDAGEVTLLKQVVYGTGGSGGSDVSRDEANFVFDINDAVSGKANDPTFTTFFVDTISSHVLDDTTSPGVVDNDEGTWLKSRIHGDGTVDDNEKALLGRLKEKAQSPIPGDLNFLFQMYT